MMCGYSVYSQSSGKLCLERFGGAIQGGVTWSLIGCPLRETLVGGEIGRKIIASEATRGVAGAIIGVGAISGAGGGAGFVGFI
jgi:hypothetical protein